MRPEVPRQRNSLHVHPAIMLARAQVRATLAISTVLAIWAVVLTLASNVHARPVEIGAALDLTGTAGLAMYLIAVRGGHLPRWMLRVTIGAGVVAARFLLGDETGYLHVLALECSDTEVVGLSIDNLGQTSIANKLVYLDNGVVFVGSKFGDSQLVKLLPAPVCPSSCLVLFS